jgi:TolB protein
MTKHGGRATDCADRTYAALAFLTLTVVALASLGSASARAASPGEVGRIAFERADEIWAVNADGTGPRRLGCPGGIRPAWSPDGQKIAFERGSLYDDGVHGGYSPSTFVIDADGGRETQITEAEAGNPAWSPDGRRIAFNTGSFSVFEPWLGVMNADGSAWTRWREGYAPAWSPDGEKIAFDDLGTGEIAVMNADGTGETRLGHGALPAWSPDGQRIAFRHWDEGWRRGAIWVMDADGGNRTRLTDPPAMAADTAPAWSPDGARIAFSRGENRHGEIIGGDIWVMNADGTGQVRLTERPVPEGYPAWQPAPAAVGSRPCVTLSVSVTGSGQGTVMGGGEIYCVKELEVDDPVCVASFAQGTNIILRANPDRVWGATFSGWGGACTGTAPCELRMNRDLQVTARFAGVPIRVQARPRQRRVGPHKRQTRYRFVVRNAGEARTGRINLCARAPQRRVHILGDRCVTRSIRPGAEDQRPVWVRIRPAARGRLTRITLIARGPFVQNRRTVARLRVGK